MIISNTKSKINKPKENTKYVKSKKERVKSNSYVRVIDIDGRIVIELILFFPY